MLDSLCSARVAHGGDGGVLLGHVVINLFMVESSSCGADVVALSHLEVFSEVLVTAPPVKMDHTKSLVSADLMEVGVSHIVLFTVSRETAVTSGQLVLLVSLSNVPSPVLNHLFFLVFDESVEQETLVEMETKTDPHESNSVGLMKGVGLPVHVSSGVLKETSYVLECSPFLCFISGLFEIGNELVEITICLLGKGSKYQGFKSL